MCLHLYTSCDLYTTGQGTFALPHDLEFSWINVPVVSNSVHFFPEIKKTP